MNWNLNFTTDDNTSDNNTAKFQVFLNDEPVFTKTLYAKIYTSGFLFNLNKTEQYLTFSEDDNEKFSFESFNEFIDDIKENKQTKFIFNNMEGEDSFEYNHENETFIFTFDYLSVSSNCVIRMDQRTKTQFIVELNKFLNWSMSKLEKYSEMTMVKYPEIMAKMVKDSEM